MHRQGRAGGPTDPVSRLQAQARFAATARDAVAAFLSLQPELSSELGLATYDDRLNDMSDGGQRELRRALRRSLEALGTIDAGALSISDAVDAGMLRNGLKLAMLDLDLVHQASWNPLVWLPGDALYRLLTRDAPPADRLRPLAARLAQIPDRLTLARHTVDHPPRVHAETALTQTEGTLALVRDDVSRLLAQEPSLRSLVEPAQAAAERALAEHRKVLADQVKAADGDPRLGPELFEARLRLVLDSEFTAAEIVARAQERLDELAEELRCAVGGDEDSIRAALDAVGRDAATSSTIVPLARQALTDATEAMRRLELATVPDEMLDVVVMPQSRRGVAVAYCDPPGR